jgi:hypothetical protein
VSPRNGREGRPHCEVVTDVKAAVLVVGVGDRGIASAQADHPSILRQKVVREHAANALAGPRDDHNLAAVLALV